jgi:DNA repair exonuclease SbcCD nuclease subunit
VKILCTADIHIGRRPSRLPERVDTSALSCARAWSALVERAIAEGVDLLLVAGDLVEQANRFYEAAGAVEAGVRALAARGIPTIAVAGNHDHDSLPWIARGFAPDEFRLLGGGGVWERHTVRVNGEAVLHVDGWSFPAGVVTDDPVRQHPRPSGDGVPVIGLLHADLEQPQSRHAPVTLASLRSAPVDFWLLGHVHRPARHELSGAATVLYPGSLQAMDPGEPGLHGPWLVELDAGGRFHARQLALSSVRYESVAVDVEGVAEEGEVDRRVVDAVRRTLMEIEPEAGALLHLSLRVRLEGHTPLHRLLERRSWEGVEGLESRLGDVRAMVERVQVATRPERDLASLARGHDAPALLARLVGELDGGEPSGAGLELVRSAMARAEQVEGARQYLPLGEAGATSEAEVREVLREQALLLLDELLAEREVA